MFGGLEVVTVQNQMSFYAQDATLTYELKPIPVFSIKAMARHRNDQPAGGVLQYWKNDGNIAGIWDDTNTFIKDITTTELGVTLRYAPGETYVNRSSAVSRIAGCADLLPLHPRSERRVGWQYNFNLAEASIRKRFWFGSWGKLDITARAGAQWNTVPFPFVEPAHGKICHTSPSTTSHSA